MFLPSLPDPGRSGRTRTRHGEHDRRARTERLHDSPSWLHRTLSALLGTAPGASAVLVLRKMVAPPPPRVTTWYTAAARGGYRSAARELAALRVHLMESTAVRWARRLSAVRPAFRSAARPRATPGTAPGPRISGEPAGSSLRAHAEEQLRKRRCSEPARLPFQTVDRIGVAVPLAHGLGAPASRPSCGRGSARRRDSSGPAGGGRSHGRARSSRGSADPPRRATGMPRDWCATKAVSPSELVGFVGKRRGALVALAAAVDASLRG